jgi:hypothetical protein
VDPVSYELPIPPAPPVPIFTPFTVEELNAALPATVQSQGRVIQLVQPEHVILTAGSPTPTLERLMSLHKGPSKLAPKRPIADRVTASPSSSNSFSSAPSSSSATTPLVTPSLTLTAPASSSFYATSRQPDSQWKLFQSDNPSNAFWLSRGPNKDELESLKKQLRSQAPAGTATVFFRFENANSAGSPLMQVNSSSLSSDDPAHSIPVAVTVTASSSSIPAISNATTTPLVTADATSSLTNTPSVSANAPSATSTNTPMSSVSDAQRVRKEQQQKEGIQKQQTQVPQQEIDSWLGLTTDLSIGEHTARLEQLIKWYDAGRQFLRMIHDNPDVEHVPTEEDLRNLTWFFYLNAGLHERNNFFEEGTFRIIDATQQESKTIKALYEVFELFAAPRSSSHLQEYPHTDFGIDVSQLPAGKRHLLLALLTPNSFYLKPENYGVKGVKNGLLHLWEWAVAQVRKTPLARPLGMRSDSSDGWRKERAEILKTAKPLLEQVASILGRNERPCKETIKDYIDFFTKVLPEITNKNEAFAKEIKAFIDRIINKYPDTWRERIGNEVILSVNELLNAPDVEIDGSFLRIRR